MSDPNMSTNSAERTFTEIRTTALIDMLPDTDIRRIISYCRDTLHISPKEMQRVLFDAESMASAINTILDAGTTSSEPNAGSILLDASPH